MATHEVIKNGRENIAMSHFKEKMRVQADGRKTFQRGYLFPTERSNEVYDAIKDGPSQGIPPSLPTAQELQKTDNVQMFLEVGIVIGSQPDRYVPTGAARNSARDQSRQARGILGRDENALRAYIPTSRHVPSQAKFFVACKPTSTHCSARSIKMDYIFFYEEYLTGIDDSTTRKALTQIISANCKHAAAEIETGSDKFTAAVNVDEPTYPTLSKSRANTSTESLIPEPVLQNNPRKRIRSENYMDNTDRTQLNASSGLPREVPTPDSSIAASFNCDNELSDAKAKRVVSELKVRQTSFVADPWQRILTNHPQLNMKPK